MAISKFNDEGYPDPVAYAALTSVVKLEKDARAFRPIVYICSPYSGDVCANAKNARRYSRFAVDIGYIPITPHLLYPQFLNENLAFERELGLHFARVLMRFCAEVWVFGNTISSGMAEEIKTAERKHIIVRYFSHDLREEAKNERP